MGGSVDVGVWVGVHGGWGGNYDTIIVCGVSVDCCWGMYGLSVKVSFTAIITLQCTYVCV